MDVGGATRWSPERVVSRSEILRALETRYGRIEPVVETSSAPADRYRLSDDTVVGIIASTTTPFCADCDRSRLTADGLWYLCLYAQQGTDLRAPLRRGASDDELKALIVPTWQQRADRGAEERLALRDRSPLMQIRELRRDPHLEMHTRGGSRAGQAAGQFASGPAFWQLSPGPPPSTKTVVLARSSRSCRSFRAIQCTHTYVSARISAKTSAVIVRCTSIRGVWYPPCTSPAPIARAESRTTGSVPLLVARGGRAQPTQGR
jgi:hypothetical protein